MVSQGFTTAVVASYSCLYKWFRRKFYWDRRWPKQNGWGSYKYFFALSSCWSLKVIVKYIVSVLAVRCLVCLSVCMCVQTCVCLCMHVCMQWGVRTLHHATVNHCIIRHLITQQLITDS